MNARHVGVIGNLGHDSGKEKLIGPGPCSRDLGGSINNSEAGYQRGSCQSPKALPCRLRRPKGDHVTLRHFPVVTRPFEKVAQKILVD